MQVVTRSAVGAECSGCSRWGLEAECICQLVCCIGHQLACCSRCCGGQEARVRVRGHLLAGGKTRESSRRHRDAKRGFQAVHGSQAHPSMCTCQALGHNLSVRVDSTWHGQPVDRSLPVTGHHTGCTACLQAIASSPHCLCIQCMDANCLPAWQDTKT